MLPSGVCAIALTEFCGRPLTVVHWSTLYRGGAFRGRSTCPAVCASRQGDAAMQRTMARRSWTGMVVTFARDVISLHQSCERHHSPKEVVATERAAMLEASE